MDKIMMRMSATIIPKTISFSFIFCHHIFLLIFLPCCLKSCACNQKYHTNNIRTDYTRRLHKAPVITKPLQRVMQTVLVKGVRVNFKKHHP